MKEILAGLLCCFFLCGCFRQVYMPRPITLIPPRSSSQVGAQISKVLVEHRWVIEAQSPRAFKASLRDDIEWLQVEIHYNDKTVLVKYLNSANLLYRKKSGQAYAGRRLSRWLKDLEEHLRTELGRN